MSLHIDVLQNYPVPDETAIDAQLNALIRENNKKWIVLDDDPTGVQTVHDVSVYTDWSYESICQGFKEDCGLFYILTNSRGFTKDETTKAHKEIARNVIRAAKDCGREFILISRSDSTLRGHYPLETMLLREAVESESKGSVDGEILCPFFAEGGRYTLRNVHYVQYGEALVPAGETEFAADKTFGYKASDLKAYVEEKTGGVYRAEDVISISLESLRHLELDKIEAQLMQVKGFNKIIVNAINDVDLKIFCIALYRAMNRGKLFMFRTAAGFVRAVGGISKRPLLSQEEMVRPDVTHGGLVVVGSHTEKTTQQLGGLKGIPELEFIEFDSDLVLEPTRLEDEIKRVQAMEEQCIRQGKTAVVYTKRTLLTLEGDTKEDALRRSVKISDAVQRLVDGLCVEPAFIIAKGGITSSDIGIKALKVKKARVMGQIQPGIPVWQLGPESKFPSMPYVIFPGNVGDAQSLAKAVRILLEAPPLK